MGLVSYPRIFGMQTGIELPTFQLVGDLVQWLAPLAQ